MDTPPAALSIDARGHASGRYRPPEVLAVSHGTADHRESEKDDENAKNEKLATKNQSPGRALRGLPVLD